jgi:putative photosynthetic complex assembly protein
MSIFTQIPNTRVPDEGKVPTFLVRSMFTLVTLCLVLVTGHTLLGNPVVSKPPVVEAQYSRVIYLDAKMSGAATVYDENHGLIADLSPEQGGFIAGIGRVLYRERTKHGVALDGPVTLVRGTNGRISIHDASTNWSADLMGFGIDNARAFARLLD